MKIKLLLAVCLCLLTLTGSLKAQTDFDTFWTTFKSAVIKGDIATVASLTKFPLIVSVDEGKPAIKKIIIKDIAKFRQRYRDIFGKHQVASCFAEKELYQDQSNQSGQIECFDGTYSSRYQFKLTKKGWKFVAADFGEVGD